MIEKDTIYNSSADEGLYGIFNDSFPPILDGVTLTVQNYAHWFTKKDMLPCVVTPWNPESRSYPYEVMRYFSLPIWNRKPYRYGYPKLDPFIWRRLRKKNFKILHSHCPFSSGRLAVYVKKKQNIPLIGTFHSKYRQDLEHSFRHAPWCVPIIMKRILDFFNACDEVWIPQAYVEETVREYGYKGKLRVMENGNDFASIVEGDLFDYKSKAKKSLGISEDEMALLFVGQHIKEKGVDTILDSLEEMNGNVKFRMNFIGTGYAFDEMKQRIYESNLKDKVKLHGVVNEREALAAYYAASDLFLFPSFYDNAPLVVREAAAMGTPSVLLKGSTAAEVISDEKNGFLVNKNPGEFSDLVKNLADDRDKLRRVAAGARESLVRSWEDVVDEVSENYKRIMVNYKK
ncbi:MAG: glycosyltransferase [Muribaculaceae bacterium]|nr:glycosyltransferase [Muribaculaceae bacterium]